MRVRAHIIHHRHPASVTTIPDASPLLPYMPRPSLPSKAALTLSPPFCHVLCFRHHMREGDPISSTTTTLHNISLHASAISSLALSYFRSVPSFRHHTREQPYIRHLMSLTCLLTILTILSHTIDLFCTPTQQGALSPCMTRPPFLSCN